MSTASMPMPLLSGFAGFDDAPRVRVSRPAAAPSAAADAVVERQAVPVAPTAIAPVAAGPADVATAPLAFAPAAPGLLQSPAWQPASSGRVRAVEGAVIAALCGWFFYGGLAVLGWV